MSCRTWARAVALATSVEATVQHLAHVMLSMTGPFLVADAREAARPVSCFSRPKTNGIFAQKPGPAGPGKDLL